MIIFKYGSVFDDKCDLLILPCSSNGSVTSWVRNEIEKNNLPFPSYSIPFGNISFIDTENKYRNTYYVGYAASVNNDSTSNIKRIRSILIKIKEFITNEKLSLVNIPVLGTGYGKLDYEEVIQLYREIFESLIETINIYIPNRDIAELYIDFNNVDNRVNAESNLKSPRVFISYSWKSKEVQDWVKTLADTLCANGVNARLDKYHLKPGNDMPQWMTDELIKADKVLLICDEYYSDKANVRKAGVGWETMIIQGDMLTQGVNNKYIAVAFGDFDQNIPIYMKSKLAISKEEIDRDVKNLLINLFDIDIAPEVSEIPDWIKAKLKSRN